MADVPAPEVPADRLGDGWERREDAVETLVDLPAARVYGRTVRYEDEALRERVRAAADVDSVTRFLFATRLAFDPPLGSGAGALVRPTVAAEARRAFADRLRERGFEDVERTRRERTRTASGARLTLAGYRGTYPVGRERLPVEGWVGVWNDDGFRVAGGAYPRSLAALGLEATDFREDLLAAIRRVE